MDLVDDLVYGESYVRTNMRLSDKGPKKLAQQMQQKGLKPEIIEQALSQYTFDDQVQNAHLKVKQTLYQKGFDLDMIQRFITEKEEESE